VTLCFQYNSYRGPGVPENLYGDTSFRDVPSPHLTWVRRDVLMQGHCFSVDSSGGPGVVESSCGDTWFRDVPSPHLIQYAYAFAMHYDRDATIQGHCVSRTINVGDQGSQKIRTGTHRFGTSFHPTISFQDVYHPRIGVHVLRGIYTNANLNMQQHFVKYKEIYPSLCLCTRYLLKKKIKKYCSFFIYMEP